MTRAKDISKIVTDANLSGTLEVTKGASGASANAAADELVLQNSGDAGLSILSPNANNSQILLGSPVTNAGGIIRWTGDDNAVKIGTNNTGGTLRFHVGGFSEVMRISSAGKVGIGTSIPTGKLEINGSDNALFAMRTTGDTANQVMGTQYLNNSGAVTAQTFATGDSSSSSVFRIKAIGSIDLIGGDIGVTGASPDLRITADGKVGIGTDSPITPLDVRGTSATDLISALFTTTSAGAADDTNTVFIGCEGNTGRGATITAKKTNSSGAHQLSIGVSNNSATPVEQVRIDKIGGFYFNSGYGSVAAAYGCRAWVKFNGTGTVAINGSANVSSITDRGTGSYTVNFATSMPDANYSTSNSTNFSGTGGWGSIESNTALYTSSSVGVQFIDRNGGTYDPSIFCVSIFR